MEFDGAVNRVCGADAERVRWLLDLLGGGASVTTPSEVAPLIGPYLGEPARFLHFLAFWAGRLAGFTRVDVQRDGDATIVVGLRDGKDRAWHLRCCVAESPPHRLEYYGIARPLPPGVRLRRADATALAALEGLCPIERADGSRVTLVRGRSVFEQLRLADWAGLWIAEEGDALVACYATAAHRARVDGRDVDLIYLSHTRVHPRHRRLGLNETLLTWIGEERFRHGIRGDGVYVYVDPQNQVIRDWSPTTPWRARPLSALLRCDAVAGPDAGGAAVRDDAARIAALLNATHGDEELFVPYDASRLLARLSRLPERYGFDALRVDGDAVVGVWNDGEQRILEHGDVREGSRRATVLDWGSTSSKGGLDALEALLRGWCGRLAGVGVTHLSMFFSDTSPAASLLRSLAESVVEIEFRCGGIEEPADAVRHGIYVDPVYF